MMITKKISRTDETRIMPNLPGDIVNDILFMLPAKSLCRFRCVCKHWCSLLNNHNFMESRLKHSIERENLSCFSIENHDTGGFSMQVTESLISSLYSDDCEYVEIDSPFQNTGRFVEIVGSCNGLVLVRSHPYDRTESHPWLWNLHTEEWKEILFPKVRDIVNFEQVHYCKIYGSTSYGIGYNSNTDDYTIMVSTYYSNVSLDRHVCQIQAYTLEPNSWKTFCYLFPYELPYETTSMYGKAEVIFVSGAFYWIARRPQSNKTCIVSFDIHGENFNEVAVTPQVDELLNHRFCALGILGGCLCIIVYFGYCYLNIEVWVMKNYSVKESWTKAFVAQPRLPRVTSIPYVKLLWEFKNGDVLFVVGGANVNNCCLVLYDSLSKNCKATEIKHIAHRRWNIEAYGEKILASLDSIKRDKRPRT